MLKLKRETTLFSNVKLQMRTSQLISIFSSQTPPKVSNYIRNYRHGDPTQKLSSELLSFSN